MTDQEKKQKYSKYLEKIASATASDPDIVKAVQDIERRIKTTKGNYGRYMALLQPYAKEKAFCAGLALGLIRAGADAYGVRWALKLLLDMDVI
jgi:hypothetical protein